ncbi:hypothetical protein SAMN05421874_118129 [Nonomuraea maritima]|uniref:Uncharacterized protein n=1 Tax=Nonomuraea maritima TaxID=683260 RepID=A0A1G9IPH6_9ACTN|nr:hypothetical protein [Nonomuraea maritima]SDL26843.1 hypothetical protein SAMN05421874_118129 [Nonomuraea maritima]
MNHRTDWMALLSGVLFVVLGILVVTRAVTDWVVLVGVLLLGLAFAGLVAIIARGFRGK